MDQVVLTDWPLSRYIQAAAASHGEQTDSALFYTYTYEFEKQILVDTFDDSPPVRIRRV